MALDIIKNFIAKELDEFNKIFKSETKTDSQLLNVVLTYVFKRNGKQLRPMFVFLSAKLVGEVNNKTYAAATMIELLHTATLVHDDVVDNSQLRRNFFSVKELWQSKVAVLVGDYLLAMGLKISVNYKAYDLLKIMSDTVQLMAEGELIQLKKSREHNLTENDYYEIIRRKTGALIKAATLAGIQSVTEDEKFIKAISDFGMNIGIAFQIKDDIIDFENSSDSGKSKNNDIQEGKLTLPLIHALSNASIKEKREILKKLKSKKKKLSEINEIKNFVVEKGGFDYSKQKLLDFVSISKNILESNFDESEARNAMLSLITFIIDRKQ